MTKSHRVQKQNGSMFIGLVLGLITGLAIAIAVALYITRSPSPIVQKNSTPEHLTPLNPSSSDPNRPLQGRAPAEPVQAPPAATLSDTRPEQTENQTQDVSEAPLDEAQIIEVPSPSPPAEQTSGRLPERERFVRVNPAPSPGRPPVSEAPRAKINTGYYLQAGTYRVRGDAEARRAELALQGFEAKISQHYNMYKHDYDYYRVQVGPFEQFDQMKNVRRQLSEAGIRTVVIRFREK